MTSLKDFVFVFFLITVINSAPLPGSEFCSNSNFYFLVYDAWAWKQIFSECKPRY